MSIGKKIALGAIALVSAVVLLLMMEHFTGKWALRRWKTRMAAKGEIFDIDRLAPPLIPAERNGMPAFVWASGQLPGFGSDIQLPTMRYVGPGKVIPVVKVNDWWNGSGPKATNVSWAVLAAELKKYETAIQHVIEALEAEELQSNVQFRQGFSTLPSHLGAVKRAASALSICALYDAHEGRLAEATTKLQALLRIPESLQREPLMISQLVRMAIAQIAFAATWQALQANGWSDEQLAAIQDAWRKHDFLAPCADALSMERAMAELEFDRFRNSDAGIETLWDPTSGGNSGSSTAAKYSLQGFWDSLEEIPEFFRDHVYFPIWKFAWSYQDQLYYCQRAQSFLEMLRPAIRQHSAAVLIRGKASGNDEENKLSFYSQIRFLLSSLMSSTTDSFVRRAWFAETVKELALAGIALKRYELQQSKFPERLEALVPEFLPEVPIDPMDGTPLKYCASGDGFILYSIGWDGKDGGGDATSDSGKTVNYQYTKDVVWPQPASIEEVGAHWKKQ